MMVKGFPDAFCNWLKWLEIDYDFIFDVIGFFAIANILLNAKFFTEFILVILTLLFCDVN